jgi:hypothetical protein
LVFGISCAVTANALFGNGGVNRAGNTLNKRATRRATPPGGVVFIRWLTAIATWIIHLIITWTRQQKSQVQDFEMVDDGPQNRVAYSAASFMSLNAGRFSCRQISGPGGDGRTRDTSNLPDGTGSLRFVGSWNFISRCAL